MRALPLAVLLLLVACGSPVPEPDPPDAGALEAGPQDAGPPDVPLGVAPRSNVSHYSWAQGCGCSSGGDAISVLALALICSRRMRRPALGALAALALLATSASAQQPKPAEVEPAPERQAAHQWTLGVRAELEALGILDRQPAIAPAIFATWGRGLWGAAVAVIVLPTIGVRAEGRLHLLEASPVRPLFGLGATLFGTAFAPRGVVGVTADLGPVRLSLDAAIEYFVSGPFGFEPLAILSGFGVAWRF